ncbi:MXAN_6640 family putative metalloprotease [Nocardioides antri]|uniref:Neutral metalloproteinase n=1 Tax=Nocardioides antri TaxID=2607659 RepID=A0A5B1M7U6_9ACTN|nr:MXAN_6640 family putative metalloprotease [Nocardioides antri]KAA1428794.1 hypothetical protein F0U47_00815 [Nocardioides antri]
MRFPRALIALPVALTLGLTLGAPAAVADEVHPPTLPGSQASPTGQANRSEQAQQALAEVEAILRGDRTGQRGRTTDGRSLTVALRDLRVLKDALPADDQKKVERMLQRPDDTSDPYDPDDDLDDLINVPLPLEACQGVICVHYTETDTNGGAAGNGHAPTGSDGDPNTVPAYVTQVLDTTRQIHADYLAAGYRRPKPDGSIGGGTNVVDIYLGDIGDSGIYGYCTSDDPNDPNTSGDYSLWAYCTLDDDYRTGQFPRNTPTENMQVTAAHEYFHAVQYAYDAYEDGWILESTAAWVEDEMFDAVNDNRQYLRGSPISHPGTPLDHFGDGFHYGTWIWWRYLTEKFPAREGRLPKLVLDVWNRLDGRPSGPDDYSMQGLSRVLGTRGTSLQKEFQLFSAANRHPKDVYDEGGSYRASPTGLTVRFGSAARKGVHFSPWHLSSGTARLKPVDLSQRDWKVRIRFNAPATARGGAFVALVHKTSGRVDTSVVRLSRTGAGTKTLPFSSRSIKGVDVVFVNTSARFDCWQNATPYSCFGGIPLDDGLRSEFVAKAFRS